MKTIKFRFLGKTYFFGNLDENKNVKKTSVPNVKKTYVPQVKKLICNHAGWCKEESGNNSTGKCDRHHQLVTWGF